MKYSYILLVFLVLLLLFIFTQKKSGFNDVLDGQINNNTPVIQDMYTSGNDITLLPPDVAEERAFPLYGDGVSMDRADSNIIQNSKNLGPLHTSFKVRESSGESSFTENINSRIIKIKNAGKQNIFNGFEEVFYPAAFINNTFLNNKFVSSNQYDDYNPNDNLILESSPGSVNCNQQVNCESTYPKVVNFNGMCLTEGDIPYEQIVNGKVNPRLVSRWESFTGDYDPNKIILNNGLLYPII